MSFRVYSLILSGFNGRFDRVNRRQKLLFHFSSDSNFLEFGPLDKPLLDKKSSSVFYVDYASLEELRELYKNDPSVDCSNLCRPDFIWGKEDLKSLTAGKTFSGAVASHVIEHVPDFIGWLKEIESVLSDAGILSLAIPDKRFTFDIHRRTSSLSEMVECFLLQSRKPNLRQVFDQLLLDSESDTYTIWRNGPPSPLITAEKIQKAFQETLEVRRSNSYHNVHCWVFTPKSFLINMYFLSVLRLTNFELIHFWPTETGQGEFILILRKIPTMSESERLQLQIDSLKKWGLKLAWLSDPMKMEKERTFNHRLFFFGSRFFSKFRIRK
jgi:hypothetical protein